MKHNECSIQAEQVTSKNKSTRNIIKGVIYGGTVFIIIFFTISKLFPPICYSREKARQIGCASILKSIGLCMKQYAMDYEEHFPVKTGWDGFEDLRTCDYLTDRGFYICPSTVRKKAKSGPLRKESISYIYLGGFMESKADETEVGNIPFVFDIPSNHQDYINVLFLDGRVENYNIKVKSCREVIEELNSMFDYSPKHLKLLYKKADIADQMYNLK